MGLPAAQTLLHVRALINPVRHAAGEADHRAGVEDRAGVQVALVAVEIEEHEGGRARDAGRASDGEKAEKPCAATISGLRPIAPAGGVSAGAARSAGDITQFRHNQAEVCRLGRDVSAVCARMITCETWFGLRGSPG